MKRLLTFDEHNYTDSMPVYQRLNVRGIIFQGGKLAMERSRAGEYKFPGGGVDPGESNEDALCRELREETGLVVIPSSIRPLGEIVEKRRDLFDENRVYLCRSLYYACAVENKRVAAAPTASELRDGFALKWAAPQEILKANEPFDCKKRWIARDSAFLRLWMEGEL